MEVGLWRRVANSELRKRAPALALQMESTACDVRTGRGNDKLVEPDGAGMLLTAARFFFCA